MIQIIYVICLAPYLAAWKSLIKWLLFLSFFLNTGTKPYPGGEIEAVSKNNFIGRFLIIGENFCQSFGICLC